MINIIELFRAYPQVVIFLALAIGYAVGKIKFFGFNLGSTAGVLLVALVLGQMNIPVSSLLEAIMFGLFIFCIGYKVGPQFFGGLKKEGLRYIVLSTFVAAVGLAVAYLLGKFFHFDPGITAGMLGGAMTQTTIIGTATEAIKQLSIGPEAKALFTSHVAIAYAITYVFGTAGLVVYFKLLPRMMGFDIKAECIKLEHEMSGSKDEEADLQPEAFLWNKMLDLRIYAVKNSNLYGKTVAEIEVLFPVKISIDNIKREGKILDFNLTQKVQADDLIAIVAGPGNFIKAEEIIGPEVDDKELGRLVGEVLKICVLNKDVVGKTIGDLSKQFGHGCFFKKVMRMGHELPLTKNTVIEKCDELEVIGAQRDVEGLAKYLGYPERPTAATDLILVGIGCAFGTLLGLLSLHLGYIPITLGVGGGILVSGLICGWLRSRHPTFGVIPAGAQWLLIDLGLNLFIACVGLVAGPKAIEALQSTGPSLFFAGIVLTLVPMISGTIFGRYVLRMNPIYLIGALTGAGTITAALNAVKEEADSTLPVIGYTVPYAFGNVILTVWGTVIVYLMS
jgi:putative transport protein